MKNFIKPLKNKKVLISFFVLLGLILSGGYFYIRATAVLPPAAVYFLSDVTLPQAGQKLLVFSPHPDDETIGAGGYISEAVKNNAQVEIVLITDGNRHGQELQRYQEFKKATAILGVGEKNLVFLGLPDGRLKEINHGVLKEALKKQIDDFDPDFLIIPHPKDIHPDHALSAQVALEIIAGENKKRVVYEYIVHDRRFPQPKKYRPQLFLLPPLDLITSDKAWQRLMLSSAIEEQKTQAIFSYTSQLQKPFLRSLILSSIRRNELFATIGQND